MPVGEGLFYNRWSPIPKWARIRVTSLLKTNALPPSQVSMTCKKHKQEKYLTSWYFSVLRTNSADTFIDQNSWTDSIRRHTSLEEDMSGCFRNRSASLYVQLYSFTDLQHCITIIMTFLYTIHNPYLLWPPKWTLNISIGKPNFFYPCVDYSRKLPCF